MVKIVYKDVAPDAAVSAVPTMADKMPFVNLNDLKLEDITVPQAATLEKDYWGKWSVRYPACTCTDIACIVFKRGHLVRI